MVLKQFEFFVIYLQPLKLGGFVFNKRKIGLRRVTVTGTLCGHESPPGSASF